MNPLRLLEDVYYSFVDWLVERGIPVDKVIEPLEERGINSFYVFLGLVALMAAGILYFTVPQVVELTQPEHVFFVADKITGEGFPGAKVILLVDGEKREFFTDEDGYVRVRGTEVRLLGVEVDGYEKVSLYEGNNGVKIVLAPKKGYLKVFIEDYLGKPVVADLNVLVDGKVAYSSQGSRFNLCFSEAKTEDCIELGNLIKLVIKANGITEEKELEVTTVEDLPSKPLVIKIGKKDEQMDLVSKKATITLKVFYDDGEPFVGQIRITPSDSSTTGKLVNIVGGIGSIELLLGRYKISSAEALINNRLVSVEVKEGKTFTVRVDTTVKIVVVKPKEKHTVKFTVKDMEGRYVRATIELRTDTTTLKRRVSTTEFTFDKETCGTYTVSADGYLTERGRFCTGKKYTVILREVPKLGTVLITVKDLLGEPIDNIEVYITDVNGNPLTDTSTTDSYGKVTFTLPPGVYRAAIVGGHEVLSHTFNVKADRITRVTVTYIPNPVETAFFVTQKGLPIRKATVEVFLGNKKIESGITDVDGHVVFKLPSGVELTWHIVYKGITYEGNHFIVPPGSDNYSIRVDINPFQEGFRFLGLFSKGKPVSSVEKGKEYIIALEVSHKAPGTLIIKAPDVELVSSSHNIQKSGDTLKVRLEKTNIVEKVYIKIKLPDSFSHPVLFLTAEWNKLKASRTYYVVGETDCSLLSNACVKLGFDHSSIEFAKNYTFTFVAVPKGDFNISLIATWGDESKVLCSGGKPYVRCKGTFSLNKATDASNVEFLVLVTKNGEKIEYKPIKIVGIANKTYGKLNLTINSDNIVSSFFVGDVITVSYSVTIDGTQIEGITPIVKLTCGATEMIADDWQGKFENINVSSCSTLNISVDALYYEGDSISFRKIGIEFVRLGLAKSSIKIEGDKLKLVRLDVGLDGLFTLSKVIASHKSNYAILELKTSSGSTFNVRIPEHVHIPNTDCNVITSTLLLDSKGSLLLSNVDELDESGQYILFYTTNCDTPLNYCHPFLLIGVKGDCEGLIIDTAIPADIYFSNKYIGTEKILINITKGKIGSCVKIREPYIYNNRYFIEVVNGCNYEVKVSASVGSFKSSDNKSVVIQAGGHETLFITPEDIAKINNLGSKLSGTNLPVVFAIQGQSAELSVTKVIDIVRLCQPEVLLKDGTIKLSDKCGLSEKLNIECDLGDNEGCYKVETEAVCTFNGIILASKKVKVAQCSYNISNHEIICTALVKDIDGHRVCLGNDIIIDINWNGKGLKNICEGKFGELVEVPEGVKTKVKKVFCYPCHKGFYEYDDTTNSIRVVANYTFEEPVDLSNSDIVKLSGCYDPIQLAFLLYNKAIGDGESVDVDNVKNKLDNKTVEVNLYQPPENVECTLCELIQNNDSYSITIHKEVNVAFIFNNLDFRGCSKLTLSTKAEKAIDSENITVTISTTSKPSEDQDKGSSGEINSSTPITNEPKIISIESTDINKMIIKFENCNALSIKKNSEALSTYKVEGKTSLEINLNLDMLGNIKIQCSNSSAVDTKPVYVSKSENYLIEIGGCELSEAPALYVSDAKNIGCVYINSTGLYLEKNDNKHVCINNDKYEVTIYTCACFDDTCRWEEKDSN